MNTPEAHAVHIETLYKKIDALASDCETQHKEGLQAIQRLHARIDEFTSILLQLSEINKDLHTLFTHQKALDLEVKEMSRQVDAIQRQVDDHSGTIRSVHRIAWGVAGFVALALGGAVFKVIGL